MLNADNRLFSKKSNQIYGLLIFMYNIHKIYKINNLLKINDRELLDKFIICGSDDSLSKYIL
ncbi:unnamed protein product [Commensalibacter papalotli (ex Botero et al. 2024)]|uniref:Transposase n=1 Tax=Commensalibacter papalotli (ex Botero et al. 2024) TaxID=2972766 RepID=A0ABM9HUW4_9PROT|nr:unnamed protein product [Commensalibacter papalotli (ex Botero et al. 2024)]CAI3957951.1 unnamed protein product [Commensalibacter papalotli (ex Botero et al. 2024)]